MNRKEIIAKNLNNTIEETNFSNLGTKKKGKVRDVYLKDDKLFLVTTDRLSAFDRVLTTIPYKGQVLTETSHFWFEKTKNIVDGHIVDYPDPNVLVCKNLEIFPVEFVVRGYLTGTTSTSAWMAYQKGEREFCGCIMPEGMKKNQIFKTPLLTPTTKSDLRDEKISAKEIIAQNLMTEKEWQQASEIVFALFRRGQEIAKENGLILVDTKYELGKDSNGKIYLCDEIHTPDSSRYWLNDSYHENFEKGLEPKNIDKEFLRLWFKENCDPYQKEDLPNPPEELIVELSDRYIQLYEMITGKTFHLECQNVEQRMKNNLIAKNYL